MVPTKHLFSVVKFRYADSPGSIGSQLSIAPMTLLLQGSPLRDALTAGLMMDSRKHVTPSGVFQQESRRLVTFLLYWTWMSPSALRAQ